MTTEQPKLIPYVILEAHPDRKRPYVLPYFDSIEENKLNSVLLRNLVEFVYGRIDVENLVGIEDIQRFWDNFYTDSYMDIIPWEAKAVINGEWTDIKIDDKDLLEELLKEITKKKEKYKIILIHETSSSNDDSDDNLDD